MLGIMRCRSLAVREMSYKYAKGEARTNPTVLDVNGWYRCEFMVLSIFKYGNIKRSLSSWSIQFSQGSHNTT